jgi:hypothetical protein
VLVSPHDRGIDLGVPIDLPVDFGTSDDLLLELCPRAIRRPPPVPFVTGLPRPVPLRHLVATHYGLYNTFVGTGILLGNLFTGTALDLARTAGMPALPWLTLTVIGTVCAVCVHRLSRSEVERATAAVPTA